MAKLDAYTRIALLIMQTLHIANTNFEWELEQTDSIVIDRALERFFVFTQLQFLPFLYAPPSDGVVMTNPPDPDYRHRLHKLGLPPHESFLFSDDFPFEAKIDSWGASLCIKEWAEKKHLHYDIPDMACIRKVNSKEFSFTNASKLPQAALLHSESEALGWLRSFSGDKVLKSAFGVSGRGHHLLCNSDAKTIDSALLFCKREWDKELPVIAEPWVKRVLDFSTQWLLSKEGKISYLGATVCENDSKGTYKRSIVGDDALLHTKYTSYLEQHIQVGRPILEKMQGMGYFGHVGIDAMIYCLQEGDPDALFLHPVVEINARKTMGFVANQMQKSYFPKETISLSYQEGHVEGNLLPNSLCPPHGKHTLFSKQLILGKIVLPQT